MARKNPFASIIEDSKQEQPSHPVIEYAAQGASKAILSSLSEIASHADALAEGEVIVELDPELVDQSFVRDRRTEDEVEFQELLKAIREGGQNSPILVRPHPRSMGRYMVVFGHRRLRAAQELGRKVRAIVRNLEDREHVLALGHENSARANVPFIERARFASDVARLNYDEDHATLLSALSTDRTTLSKMLSVASLPNPILDAIGDAKGVGRDRWYELKLLLDKPGNLDLALSLLEESDLKEINSSQRFDWIVQRVKAGVSRKRVKPRPTKRNWAPKDASLVAEMLADGKRFTMSVKSKTAGASEFGVFLSGRLDELYEAFCSEQSTKKQGG